MVDLYLKTAFERRKIVPYPDIIHGKITENSFAVSLQAVLNRTADKIYTDPKLFFPYTHFTTELQGIIKDLLLRIDKGGSRPLLVIDTAFGGGKTHALVALYHLFRNSQEALKDPTILKLIKELTLQGLPEAILVPIDCHGLSSVKRKGAVRTIWGEIAKQLGQYENMEVYDQQLRRPDASTLAKMLNDAGKPVVIILDELVNYLKDARAEQVGTQNLAEITVSFFHTFTDVIVNSEKSMLIITLPGTESAYEAEAELLEQYKTKIKGLAGREASFTVPMDKSEIYEVIQTRLFEKIDKTLARQVAEDLQAFYEQNREHFPEKISGTLYYEKILKAYPFHPEVVDILYSRISTISGFQTTRGVLRLLAHVLRNVYQNLDDLPMDSVITPGIIDLTDQNIFQELTNKLGEGRFQQVIQSDLVNADNEGKCQQLDGKYRFGPRTRLASAIYLYTLIGASKELSVGCSTKELNLAIAVEKFTHPKDTPKDMTTLENTLWYIYHKPDRWYFSVQVNINKVIADEMGHITRLEYDQELKSRLRKMYRSDEFDAHVWEHDIRAPNKITLVIANYDDIKGSPDQVPNAVEDIIRKEGVSFRDKQNLMYILVAHKDRVEKMIDTSKRYLAIKAIKESVRSRDDIRSYESKITELFKESESNLNATIELCYSIIYYPHQTQIRSASLLDGMEDAITIPDKILKALKKVHKIVDVLKPVFLVDKVFKSTQPFITVSELWSLFEENPAFPLPEKKQVLYDTISEGVKTRMFALYTGGIGDLEAIGSSTVEIVSSQFYYGHAPLAGPKPAHYVIHPDRALSIEKEFKGLLEPVCPEPPPPPSPPKSVELTDPSKIREYLGWGIETLTTEVNQLTSFSILRSKLPLLVLGVPGYTFTSSINSNQLNISIPPTPISNLNDLLDILYRLSTLFSQGISIRLSITYEEPLLIDQDVAKYHTEFAPLGEDLTFRATIRK